MFDREKLKKFLDNFYCELKKIAGQLIPVKFPISYTKNGELKNGWLINFFDSKGNLKLTEYLDSDNNKITANTISNIKVLTEDKYKNIIKQDLVENQSKRYFNLKSFSFKVVSGEISIVINNVSITYPQENVEGFSIDFENGIENDIIVNATNGVASIIYSGNVQNI